MRTPPTTGEMAGVAKGGCHETRMVQRGPLDRASERCLRSCAGRRRIRQVAERLSPTLVPVSEFKTVSTVIELTPEQFQFARALYVALPPVSRTLPPGDKAVMANSGDAVMLALVADGQACTRFLAPDFITAMVIQVGMGETGHIGTPAAYHLFVE